MRELDSDALSELCRVWSVPRPDADALTREDARRAWSLRRHLTAEGQTRFDGLPVPVQVQLTELYHDVFEPHAASR